jgi:hypothetical protein
LYRPFLHKNGVLKQKRRVGTKSLKESQIIYQRKKAARLIARSLVGQEAD